MLETLYFFTPVIFLCWIIVQVKSLFFWVYLWQLKDYHIGRFLDHFQTYKGRRIFLNPLSMGKAVCVFLLFLLFAIVNSIPENIKSYVFALFFLILPTLGVLYIAEAGKIVFSIFWRTLLLPVFTFKATLLCMLGIFLGIEAFLFFPNVWDFSFFHIFSLIDLFSFIPFSFLVLSIQPIFVLARNRIIEKAKKRRAQFPALQVVGITGSYGKTSTKELLAHILSKKFRVLKTKEHKNSEVGISQTILGELKPEHEVFVCEMGAYTRGGIKLLCDIAKPQIGVLTGINEQHMATFGSQEHIIQAKYELIEGLPPNGVAFFNAKNSFCAALYEKTKIRKVLYGQAASFPGEENMLGAMAVAKEMGMSDEEIAAAVKGVGNTFPGVQIKKGSGGITIIDAAYSANPDGVIANLDYLKTFSGKKIVVMPCLIELGKASKAVHKRIGEKIAEVCDFAIITTRDRFQEVQEGAGENVVFMENPNNIAERIRSLCKEGDVVLLEGRVPSTLVRLLW